MYGYIAGSDEYHYDSINGADESNGACAAANIRRPSFCPYLQHYYPDVPSGLFSLIADECMGVENLVSIYYLLH